VVSASDGLRCERTQVLIVPLTVVFIATAAAGFVSCKKKNRDAKNMASAGARVYMGVWGRCPQRGPGAEPWSGGQGAKPPEAEGILLPRRANLSLSFK